MPMRSKSRFPFRKKRFPRTTTRKMRRAVKSRRSAPQVARITRTPSGFPQALVMKLKYCSDNLSLTSASAAFDWHTMNMNSVFDPDSSGTGHQPLFSDQLRAIYARYRVSGCKVSVSGVATARAVMSYGGRTALHTQPTQVENASEQPQYTCRTVNEQVPIHFKKYYNLQRIAGTTKSEFQDDQYSALLSANPARLIQFDVGVASADGGGTTGACNIYIELTFYCRVYELLDVAQS